MIKVQEKNLRARLSNKGQSLIETLFFSFAFLLLMKLILLFFWLGTSLLWIEHQLYQGLVCSAEQKELKYCQKNILKQIQKLDRLGTVKSLKINHSLNEWKGELKWSLKKINFTIKQTFRPPH